MRLPVLLSLNAEDHQDSQGLAVPELLNPVPNVASMPLSD
jgi:hypothetical protein